MEKRKVILAFTLLLCAVAGLLMLDEPPPCYGVLKHHSCIEFKTL